MVFAEKQIGALKPAVDCIAGLMVFCVWAMRSRYPPVIKVFEPEGCDPCGGVFHVKQSSVAKSGGDGGQRD